MRLWNVLVGGVVPVLLLGTSGCGGEADATPAPYGGTIRVSTVPGQETCDLVVSPQPEPLGARKYVAFVTGPYGAEVAVLRADGSEAFAYRRIGNGNDDQPEREPFSKTWMAVSQTLSPGTYRAECVIHGTKVVSAAQLEVSS